ncbi:MAG: hydantoinase/oxoprolinase family protein [Deltaproteobacteria bacterium]|nr:hydantoinase/oxoprolinase family protein [Deltaproteobacteria bacterium]
MTYTVDIDVGGTLTDGIFSDGKNVECVKVDTTPHDLTVCLFDCLTQGATRLGFPELGDFLENVELIRWSTTVTSNVLAELRGPRIGLLVTRGHEKDLYGSRPASPVVNRLIAERDVIGIGDSASETEVMTALRSLLEIGARRICVSLQGSLHNPERELWVKSTIEKQYPDHFLGSVPVLAGSDICQNADGMTRTHYALINSYTHQTLAATLFKAEDELRDVYGFSRPFLICHVNGGVAGIAKTKAIDTIESGPILGVYGSSYLAKLYRLKNVIALDVGGTTAKVGALHNAEPVYSKPSEVFGIPVEVSLPYLRSIALGGGSVVKTGSPPKGSQIILGPESMGSYPGPACYSLGGDKPTLTDAFVAAGLINPEYFLGGTKAIDPEVARDTIGKSVANWLNLSLEEACRTIINHAYEMVANLIEDAKLDLPQRISDYALFAYGGNGGLFACGVVERIGLNEVYLFSLAPVFSAFGSSVSDICHVYERAFTIPLVADADVNRLSRVIDDMKAEGLKDLLGEGISTDQVTWSVELEVCCGNRATILRPSAEAPFRRLGDLHALLPADWSKTVSAGQEKIHLELVRVRLLKEIPKPGLVERPIQGGDPRQARVGTRRLAYGSKKGEAEIYRWEFLRPGDVVRGCAILEGANTTYFIPEDWVLSVDSYGNGIARRG